MKTQGTRQKGPDTIRDKTQGKGHKGKDTMTKTQGTIPKGQDIRAKTQGKRRVHSVHRNHLVRMARSACTYAVGAQAQGRVARAGALGGGAVDELLVGLRSNKA